MKNKSGITLLEMIIVLVILGMFCAISIPFFARFTEASKLKTATRSVTSVLRTARSYAITRNDDYYVVVDVTKTPNTYFISKDITTIPVKPADVDVVNRLPTGIQFANITGFQTVVAGTYAVQFTSTGAASTDASFAVQDISDTTESRTIEIERTTGRVKIQ